VVNKAIDTCLKASARKLKSNPNTIFLKLQNITVNYYTTDILRTKGNII
jgi:hypothetical protein